MKQVSRVHVFCIPLGYFTLECYVIVAKIVLPCWDNGCQNPKLSLMRMPPAFLIQRRVQRASSQSSDVSCHCFALEYVPCLLVLARASGDGLRPLFTDTQ